MTFISPGPYDFGRNRTKAARHCPARQQVAIGCFQIGRLGAAVSKRISLPAMRWEHGERGFRRATIEQRRIRV
jgi:hypothetical protein